MQRALAENRFTANENRRQLHAIPYSVASGPQALRIAYVVEENQGQQQELSTLLLDTGFHHQVFSSIDQYLSHDRSDSSACLILSLRARHEVLQERQDRLRETQHPPIIFLSSMCDTFATVWAMKAGAVEVLPYPLEAQRVSAAIQEAMARDILERREAAEREALCQRLSRLTPREREVFPLVAAGLLNKQAASVLGISQVTLQIHRGQVMKKMLAASFAELVLMSSKLGLRCPAAAMEQYVVRPRAYGT